MIFEIGGVEKYISAAKEVLVCGGTFNSPQLLELSGIGDPDRLRRLNIPVVKNLPGVGKNLQEHFGTKLIYRVNDRSISLNRVAASLPRKAMALLNYAIRRQGILAWANTYVGGFAKSVESLIAPDIQVTVNAWSAEGLLRSGASPHRFPGITFNVYHLTPESRGEVHAVTRDPRAAPEIRLAALDTEYDKSVFRSGIRLIRKINQSRAFASVRSTAVDPADDLVSDEALDAFVREKIVAMLHPVGTCRMGVDSEAVVDADLKVHGVEGLRVVDSSIMPTIPRGNTNAPTVMIAEKASSLVLRDARLQRGAVAGRVGASHIRVKEPSER